MYNFNPIALRKAKIVYNFGHSECNRVKASKTKRKGELANIVDPTLNMGTGLRKWCGPKSDGF